MAACEEERDRFIDIVVADGVGAADVEGFRALVDCVFANREAWARFDVLWLDSSLVEDV